MLALKELVLQRVLVVVVAEQVLVVLLRLVPQQGRLVAIPLYKVLLKEILLVDVVRKVAM